MFGWRLRKPRERVGTISGFGKIPAEGDFVRAVAAGIDVAEFEAWLADAMALCDARAGVPFRDGFTAGATCAFVWSATLPDRTRGLVAGVLRPSHDRVGRRFPIAITMALPPPPYAAAPHLTPIVLAGLFERAATTAERAAKLESRSELEALVTATEPPPLDALAMAASRYERWLDDPAEAALASLFADTAEATAEGALSALREVVRPLRGRPTMATTLGLRVPLGRDRVRTMATWLDLVVQAVGGVEVVPSIFLPGGAEGAHAIVQLGREPSPLVLADVWSKDIESARVCDVASRAAACATLPTELEAVLASPSATLRELRDAMAR